MLNFKNISKTSLKQFTPSRLRPYILTIDIKSLVLEKFSSLILNFFSMAEKLPFGEGASIIRPPLFCGLNYQFWKVRMKIFVESLGKGIWDTIQNCPFIPKFEKDGFLESCQAQE